MSRLSISEPTFNIHGAARIALLDFLELLLLVLYLNLSNRCSHSPYSTAEGEAVLDDDSVSVVVGGSAAVAD